MKKTPEKPKLSLINDAGGYRDYEGSLLAVPGLWIDIRLSIPIPGSPETHPSEQELPYISLHVGDENDGYAHHSGEPETFNIPWASALALIG